MFASFVGGVWCCLIVILAVRFVVVCLVIWLRLLVGGICVAVGLQVCCCWVLDDCVHSGFDLR